MVPSFEEVLRNALELAPGQRMMLAGRLLESVDQSADEESGAREIGERIARFDRGEATSIPAAEVFKGLSKVAPGL